MLLPMNDKLYRATFIERPNRFIVHAELENGDRVRVHLPDPGRLLGILVPKAQLYLRYSEKSNRKTSWTAVLAELPEKKAYVSLETATANELSKRTLQQQLLPSLTDWCVVQQEFTFGHSRWDFLLTNGTNEALLEVKSVTLAEEGLGYFPDAVTARGTKHVQGLIEAQQSGNYEAMLLFVAQREDIEEIRPAAHIDPAFSEALQRARRFGVRLFGMQVKPTPNGYTFQKEIPLRL